MHLDISHPSLIDLSMLFLTWLTVYPMNYAQRRRLNMLCWGKIPTKCTLGFYVNGLYFSSAVLPVKWDKPDVLLVILTDVTIPLPVIARCIVHNNFNGTNVNDENIRWQRITCLRLSVPYGFYDPYTQDERQECFSCICHSNDVTHTLEVYSLNCS